MKLDTIALALVATLAGLWLILMITGVIVASPYSWIIAIPLLVGLYLLVRVIQQRLGNAEDDYYEKNIKE